MSIDTLFCTATKLRNMLFLVTIVATLGTTLWSVYRGGERNNCLNEKWSMLSDSLRDPTFNQNYRYHVDSSDVSLYGATERR